MQVRDFLFLWHLATYTKGYKTQNLAWETLQKHAGDEPLAEAELPERLRMILADEPLRESARAQYRQQHFLTRLDSEYPMRLSESFQPPAVLFYQGDITLLNTLSLAIVGARNATDYTQNALNKLAADLPKLTIVSGLAQGADAMAHQFALDHHFPTIAVIANGLDVTYPKANAALQTRIAQHALVLSEYPLGMRPRRDTFVMRNRIIAGLAHGLLVTEAAEHSGSLITANLALQNNREVFALPGDITHAKSAGTNLLIQAGAKLVVSGANIIEEINYY